LVIKAQSGFFTVRTDDGRLVVCQIPGRLKQEKQDTDIVAAGDRVVITINQDGTGLVESVAERKKVISRARPAAEKRSILSDPEQVLVANPDQVVLKKAGSLPGRERNERAAGGYLCQQDRPG
jgi:putative ribosome biogenesis GTPase RsgA